MKMKGMVSLPQEFIRPNYNNGSIANVPGTVAALLGVPFNGLPPLADSLWRPFSDDVKRVVVLIVDALGANLLALEQERLQGVLSKTAVSNTLTSIFPSTTVAALSSLWTGFAPAKHGLLGLHMLFPELGVTGQMLKLSPSFGLYPDSLVRAGLEPEKFLRVPGFAEQLAASGVPTHAFKGRDIIDSVLSKMHNRGVAEDHGISSVADMFVQLRQLLEAKPGERLYACAYWPTIDTLSHVYGWDQASVTAELRSIFYLLETELLNILSLAARHGTVLCIVADHGQVVSPPERHIYLEDHPDLKNLLLLRPTGEPRTAYLYAKQGQKSAVLDYIHTHLSHAMAAYDAQEALETELFGPPPHTAETAERVGDVVVAMRHNYLLLTAKEKEKAHKMIGRHGGMTQAEMVVPWLGMRLDG